MRSFDERKTEILRRSRERIRHRKIKSSIICVLCVVAVILVGVGAQQSIEYRNTDPIYKKILKFPKVKHNYNGENFVIEDEMVAFVTPWDELSITEQYSELDFNGVRYSSRSANISDNLLLEKIGEYTAYGFDEIDWKTYTKSAEVYSVKDISSDCVVAVKLEGVDEYYIYTNAHYKPETLGDFIDDVNLKNLISFGVVRYDYHKIMGKTYINEQVEFSNVSDEYIWESLLSDIALKNVYSDEAFYESTVISVRVDIELLGYKNIGLWITKDGYMHTNILDTGKTFYIGKEKINEIMNYLLDNCDGKRYVHTVVDETMDDNDEYDQTASYEANDLK